MRYRNVRSLTATDRLIEICAELTTAKQSASNGRSMHVSRWEPLSHAGITVMLDELILVCMFVHIYVYLI